MRRMLRASLAVGFMVLFFAGCGSLFPKPVPSRFFVLSSLSPADEGKDLDHSGQISLGIGPVRLPGYLDRQEIVTRVAQNKLDLSENDRWAEPLDENFTRVLAQNLSVLLRTDRIVIYPWPLDKKPNYRVEIEVLRFESNAAQEAQLTARWTVINEGGPAPFNVKESRLVRPIKEKSTEASVAALSETVADLSREIVNVIVAADGQRKP